MFKPRFPFFDFNVCGQDRCDILFSAANLSDLSLLPFLFMETHPAAFISLMKRLRRFHSARWCGPYGICEYLFVLKRQKSAGFAAEKGYEPEKPPKNIKNTYYIDEK